MTRPPSHITRPRRRAAILVVTMLVVFTLASIVLVMCGSMRVEASASANLAAALQASCVERGAEQYVLAILTDQKDSLSSLSDDYFAAVPVGDGYFWALRPDYADDNLPLFGLVDESAKLNINSAAPDSAAKYNMLMKLPNMTDQVAGSIVDWADADDAPTFGGAEQSYYSGLNPPYLCKNAPFETVEELLLVSGVSRELLYGNGTAAPLGTRSNSRTASAGQVTTDLQTARGLYDLLTIYSKEPAPSQSTTKVDVTDARPAGKQRLGTLLRDKLGQTRAAELNAALLTSAGFADAFDLYVQLKLKPDEFDKVYPSLTAGGTPPKARVNVNTAPCDVLLCLPGLESADVDKLISQRSANNSGSASVAWVAEALQAKSKGLSAYVTGTSSQYSADLLAVSGDGRAFKRCRIVVDVSGTSPRVLYRRDLTERGWPMDPQILASLRAGQGPGQYSNTTRAMPAGGLSR